MLLSIMVALTACEQTKAVAKAAFEPKYDGIETLLLDGDLVNFRVTMRGARDNALADKSAMTALARATGLVR